MTVAVRFYFDVACPYAYLGSTQLAALARDTGAAIELRPILLGGLLREIGQPDDPNRTMPAAKTAHMHRDLARWAERYGVPLRMPRAHPRRTLLPMRAIVAASERERAHAMHALFAAYWVETLDVTDPEIVRAVLDRAGLEGARLVERASTREVKESLAARTSEAASAGIFGVPSFVIVEGPDAELFWGQDRLELITERARGGPP